MTLNYLKHFLMAFLVIFSCQYSLCSAHEGHAHPIDKKEIIEKANNVINKAIEQQKLEVSWKEAKPDEPKIVNEEKGGQWLIKYTNPKISNANKELFIFFSLDGKYIAMNHTGK